MNGLFGVDHLTRGLLSQPQRISNTTPSRLLSPLNPPSSMNGLLSAPSRFPEREYIGGQVASGAGKEIGVVAGTAGTSWMMDLATMLNQLKHAGFRPGTHTKQGMISGVEQPSYPIDFNTENWDNFEDIPGTTDFWAKKLGIPFEHTTPETVGRLLGGIFGMGVPIVPGTKLFSSALKEIALTPGPVGRSAQLGAINPKQKKLKSIRGLPVADAIKIARKEPHLRASAESSEGFYIGGPRNIKNRKQLLAARRAFDARVAADYRGGDWYDRYRASVDELTGGDPVSNAWMSAQEGQWSAGVDPGSEFGFALKENTGVLTGFPVKAGRPLPHLMHKEAARLNDITKYMRGPKTGEYADHVIPGSKLANTATGVNDFRYAQEWGFTDTAGKPQTQGLNEAQHAWLDHETALAVDRANKKALGGRTNWTGEQLQAAPWVRQKAGDLFGSGNSYRKRAKAELVREGYLAKTLDKETIEKRALENAFRDADRTIANFGDKHTAYGTYESMIGPNTGNLPGIENISEAQRAAMHADPRSSWATAPRGRDSMYAGLRYGDTGVAARVLPTVESQGIYMPPGGQLEMNAGGVARPLVGFETLPSGVKILPKGDRAMITAGETLRSALASQDAGAAHVVTRGGLVDDQRSVRIPMNRKLTPDELTQLRDRLSTDEFAEKPSGYNLNDIIDTGTGVTATRFPYFEGVGPAAPPVPLPGKTFSLLKNEIDSILPDASEAQRGSVDAIYTDLTDAWQKGQGSGAVSQKVLDAINVTPEMRAAFNNNPYLAENAINHLERDRDLAAKYGTTAREDLQRLRQIVADGPGWIERLEQAVRQGGIVPALAAAVIGGLYLPDPATANEM